MRWQNTTVMSYSMRIDKTSVMAEIGQASYILLCLLTPMASFASGDFFINHPFQKVLSNNEIASLIPPRVRDRDGWSRDMLRIFSTQHLLASPVNVCAVEAVIQQESGYDPKPKTTNMLRATERAMKEKVGTVGALSIKTTLDAKQDSIRKITYWQRIEKAKSEYDVDRVLQDFFNDYGAKGIYGKFDFFKTVGSMQVSVSFVSEQAQFHGVTQGMGEWQIREFLYTRYGGMYFGTLRLLGYPAGYDKPIYRFADYNVGMYASRNAAIQQQAARLTRRHLALDGDLLRYGKNGAAVNEVGESEQAIVEVAKRYAPNLDSRAIRNDLLLEKTIAFEDTDTYQAIKQAYQVKFGNATYARLPEVEIKSPKINSKFTTAGYARRVSNRYESCLDHVRRNRRTIDSLHEQTLVRY